jgi:4-diphosphocytidyl-2-C-methyl-D-erythritol kinase
VIQPVQPAGTITLHPPCKINLHLAVGNRRADGFHELESIFAALAFSDTLTFTALPGGGAKTALSVRAEGPIEELSQRGQVFPSYPAENNLVYLAAELFRSKTGFSRDISIELVKRIPPGSGLGGGSSDAAAALLAMNELARFDKGASADSRKAGMQWQPEVPGGTLSREDLLDLAAQLGSDVPFFIEIALPGCHCMPGWLPSADGSLEKSSARAVGGRGEIFRFLPPPPPLGVLLAFPGFASHTGAAFSLLDERRMAEKAEKQFPEVCTGPAAVAWTAPETWAYTNDFQDLFLNHGTPRERDAYRTMLGDLRQAGAIYSSLSGSGSACFGIFPGPEEAKEAKKSLNRAFYILESTFFLLKN